MSGEPKTLEEWEALEKETRARTGELGSSFRVFIDDLEKRARREAEVTCAFIFTAFNVAHI